MSPDASPTSALGRGRLLICLAAILFSTGGAAIKLVSFSGWQVVSLRSAIAAVAVLLLTRDSRRNWSFRTWLVSIGYAGTMILFVLATKLTTAANAIFLQSTSPLYLALLSPLLLKEPLRRRDLLFMTALGAGLSLFFLGAEPAQTTAPDPLKGNILAAASGVCWALTVLGLRWIALSEAGTESGSGAASIVAGNLIAFVAGLPFALPLPEISLHDLLVIFYLGVFQLGIAYLILTRAMQEVPALEAGLLLLIEPVLNPVWAAIVHGEMPSIYAILGGGTILAATTLHVITGAGTRGSRNQQAD